MKNDERKFRVVEHGAKWTSYYQVGFECTLGYIKEDLSNGVSKCFGGNVEELNKLLCTSGFGGDWLIKFEEIFNENYYAQIKEIFDWDNKEYTIDELEEGVEYSMSSSDSNFKYMIRDGKFMIKYPYDNNYGESELSYNRSRKARFTKVQPIKQYTFDEARADCIKNGTEYVGYWDGKKVEEPMILSKDKDGVRVDWDSKLETDHNFTSGIVLDGKTTWVKKSDLDR